jgi:hypothetical protein
MRTKLLRNLKRGDKLRVVDVDGKRTAIVTIHGVRHCGRGVGTGKHMYEAMGDYPWWWGATGVTGYSDTRVELA